ncbi:MAG: hypothetical protein COW59_13125 [Lysobacterales bacterium CG17_big_fil_post_rev_8_21_14_2_50_64_11]|nr:MAG: hypothetical protein COW59_13125 [Xanthomonadales bacterium CG17_big_fil_post_rev_8_21_14_2_50_64_11]PIX59365.1 MAG: DUF4426 domain-containing protein [Xanthomonadales bacterium CG_4_10_14_3_um_filter_64_11]
MQPSHHFVRIAALSLLAFAAMPSANAQHQSMVQTGDITVHYNALPTTNITADVAHQYGITRSASRALLNVAVRKGVPGEDKAVPAVVTAAATNLNGQRQELRMREVREGEAVYYLGETRIADKETLTFEITITAEGANSPLRASFQQQFFVSR